MMTLALLEQVKWSFTTASTPSQRLANIRSAASCCLASSGTPPAKHSGILSGGNLPRLPFASASFCPMPPQPAYYRLKTS
jgi:hypothetical protein